MRRCGCEYGGDCDKITLCALNNQRDEYDDMLDTLEGHIQRAEAILRNDLYKSRVRNALNELDEAIIVLEGRP